MAFIAAYISKGYIMSVTTVTNTATNAHAAAATDNTAKAFTLLDTFVTKCGTARTALIEGLHAAGFDTVEQCKPLVIKWACMRVGAVAEGGAWRTTKKGGVVMVSSHASYNTIATTVRDVMLMLEGTTRRIVSKANKAESHKTESDDGAEVVQEKKDHVSVLAAAVMKLSDKDRARFVQMMAGAALL